MTLNLPVCDYDGNKISNIQIRIRDDFLELHQEVYKWNREIYQIILLVLEDLKEFAKELDKKYIGTITPLNKKLEKYLRMFGFKGPIKIKKDYLFYYMEV